MKTVRLVLASPMRLSVWKETFLILGQIRKNEYIDMMNIFGRILYLTEFSNFLSYVNLNKKITYLPLIAIIGTFKMSCHKRSEILINRKRSGIYSLIVEIQSFSKYRINVFIFIWKVLGAACTYLTSTGYRGHYTSSQYFSS